MTQSTQVAEMVMVLLAAALLLAWASRTARIPYPIALVLGGIGIAFVPGVPAVNLDPQLVLLLFVAPLLYVDAFFAPIGELRRNAGWVALLATALVGVTAGVAAVVAHATLGLSWGVAFALGAALAATDAVAPMQVLGREGADPRLAAVIQGESLLNDGVAFTLVKVATVAVVTGAFSPVKAIGSFALTVAGGALAGLVLALAVTWVRRRTKDTLIEATLSLLTPFAAYIAADRIGASGILAAVVAGLWLGRRSHDLVTPLTRVEIQAAWRVITFVLNSLLFLLVGLEVRSILRSVDVPFADVALGAAAVLGVLTGVRLIWALALPALWRSARELVGREKPVSPKRWRFALAWSGVRGSVALAAALSLPATIHGGAPFPGRSLVILTTLVVIVVTLVAQGLTLRPALRALVGQLEREVGRESDRAREAAARAALGRLESAAARHGLSSDAQRMLEREYSLRSQRFGARARDGGDEQLEESSRRLADAGGELLAHAREAVLELEERGDVRPEIAQAVLRDLDLDAARLRPIDEQL